MGLDSDGTKFLFAAQAAGASYQRTATLGRQGFFPGITHLQSLLDLRAPGLSARTFLADSGGYAEKWLAFLGANEITAIDNSDYEGAKIVCDLNAPIVATLRDRFTAVVDGGCLEHVFNFPQAIRNCMEMLEVGGHFFGITPANNFCGHGFYQFSPELYFRVFSEANGFALRAMLTKEKSRWFRVLDPADFGRRVELQNNRPTYLFVLAQKVETRETFSNPPQQSDYARQWKNPQAISRERHAPSLGTRLRALVPSRTRDALRPLAANISLRYRYDCYQPIAEAALLRGDFCFA